MNKRFDCPLCIGRPAKLIFTVNKTRKNVVLYWGEYKWIQKCDKNDDFDWKIGLGLAISNAIFYESEKHRKHRNFFRDKKTRKLDLEKYCWWVIEEYLECDLISMQRLKEKVRKAKQGEKILLD